MGAAGHPDSLPIQEQHTVSKKKTPASAVLFDLDGVLADSMPGFAVVWEYGAQLIGTEFEPLEIYKREGEKAEDTIRALYLRAGKGEPTQEDTAGIMAKLHEKIHSLPQPELFAENVRIAEKIAQSGTPTALVTGSSMVHIEHVLPAELIKTFSAIVTGPDVENGKPDPEPYLKAAQKLGLPPEECVVVENSPHGTTAAHAAGMYTIAYASALPCEFLPAADEVATTTEELIRALGRAKVKTRFDIAYACTACGNCCLGKGDVDMTEDDITMAAKFLNMDEREFINRYCRLSKYNSRLSLINDKDDKGCVFHRDMKCEIYEARPKQCRLFPNTWNYEGFEHICQALKIIL